MDERFRSYLILGVRPEASAEEVRRAYRQLVREWHPDRAPDERKRREAERRIREINRAYETLEAALEQPRPPALSQEAQEEPVYDVQGWKEGVAKRAAASGQPPSDSSLYDRALRLYFDGVQHSKGARWQEAVSCLMQSVYLVQNNPEAHLLLGRCYRRLGQPAKAESAYKEAVRIDPSSADAQYELGEICVTLGDLAAATRQAKRLDRMEPDLAAVLRESIARTNSRGTEL